MNCLHTSTSQSGNNLESGLQELSAGDDMADLSLLQPVSDGWTPQRGVQRDHCNTDTVQSLFINGFTFLSLQHDRLLLFTSEKTLMFLQAWFQSHMSYQCVSLP